MDSWIPKPLSMGVAGATLANAVALGSLGLFAWLNQHDSDLFYQAVQEDEWLEWGTFWGFLLAAGVFFLAAFAQRRRTRLWPWFLAGVGLFCFGVGMEEISWGQRVIGYRPPSYFLAHNTQQELNVHNVMTEDFRKLGLKLVILGYGVGLPILALIPWPARALAAVAVVAPPVELVPTFAAAYWIYHDYPFKFAGEVTEFMLAVGFLFAGLTRWRELSEEARKPAGLPVWIAAGAALLLALGAANAWASRAQRQASPGNLEAARAELAAMAIDFASRSQASGGQLPTKCGLHKRLYSYQTQYHHEFLRSGQFAALRQKGLPEERAEFLLDPWNSPYWIRDKCSSDGRRRAVFIYSFGPNRRRDSTAWELGGDDPGLVLLARLDPR